VWARHQARASYLMSLDNEQWIRNLRAGDAATLERLRKVLLRNLHCALAGNRRASEGVVEDAVQDAMLKILARLDQFAGRSKFTTWATSVAIRTVMSELRRLRWKDVSVEELAASGKMIPDRAAQPVFAAERDANRNAMFHAMHDIIQQELSERQRAALLAELRGMPLAEIARQLGSNRNAVYKLTHDARKKIKRSMLAAGYSSADLASSDHAKS